MIYVLDCLFMAALFIPNKGSDRVRKALYTIQEEDEVFIPVVWWHEMGTVLSSSLSRGRLKPAEALEINRLLALYKFNTDLSYGGEYMEKILELSQFYGLNAHHAVYLELGMRKKGIIGTLSRELQTACTKAGITTL
jgi:predicted nucleic acid-binding protein